jgi:hypothetical protein
MLGCCDAACNAIGITHKIIIFRVINFMILFYESISLHPAGAPHNQQTYNDWNQTASTSVTTDSIVNIPFLSKSHQKHRCDCC